MHTVDGVGSFIGKKGEQNHLVLKCVFHYSGYMHTMEKGSLGMYFLLQKALKTNINVENIHNSK